MADSQASAHAARRKSIFFRSLATADVLAAICALFCLSLFHDNPIQVTALLIPPLVVLVSKVIGLYDRDELVIDKSTLDEAPALFQLATLYSLLVFMLEPVLVEGKLNRLPIFALWISLAIFLFAFRMAARRVARTAADDERCLFVGDETSYRRVKEQLARARTGTELIGRIPFPGHPVGSDLGQERSVDLPRLVREKEVDRVLIGQFHDSDEVLDLIRRIKRIGVRISLLPRMLEVVGSSLQFEEVGGFPLLGLRRFGLSRSSEVVKRGMDVIGAGLGLVVLSPLLAAVALAIRLDSRGAVLFRQDRIGRDGKIFAMLKFRTMVDGADELKEDLLHLNESEGLFKITEDPRITWIGRLLRRTSLDELPQLINVLRGEMSLVGPRPLVGDDDRRIEGWHRERLHLMPGMTGPWQILGSSRVPLREMVTIDYLYVVNWSLWTDIKILLRTVPCVISARGV